tara:strand:+ start:1036 stop:2727 length:1692 start_codon:yes stop_codon:yes gene_type:complete
VKWIGQHIWSFISRFRSDVYLESITDPGSDTDKFLVIDANKKIGYRTGSEVLSDIGGTPLTTEQVQDIAGALVATGGTKTGISVTYQDSTGDMDFVVDDLHNVGVDGSANQLLTDDGDGSITSESTLTYDSETLTIGADDEGEVIIARKTHSDNFGGVMSVKGGSATGTDKSGGNCNLYGGQGTGTGVGGTINLTVYKPAGSTGSSNNTTESTLTFSGVDASLQIPGDLLGPRDTDMYLKSDGNMVFGLDTDNDETSQSFSFRNNNSVEIANLDESGNLQIDGDLTVSGNDIKDDDGTTCITFDSSGNTTIAGTLAVGDIDVTSVAGQSLTLTAGEYDNPMDVVGGDSKVFIRYRDNSTAGTNVIGFGALGDDAYFRNDEGSFKFYVANDATVGAELDQSGNLEVSGKITTTHDYHATTFENQIADDVGTGKILKYSPGANDTLNGSEIYFLHTDGTWDQADADNVATGASQILGVGLGGSSQTVGVLIEGFIRIASTEILNTPGSGAVDGLPLYVSTTPGHFDFTAPSGTADFVRIVGYAIDDNGGDVLVYFNPDKTWVEVS